jgi:hypothetical protein
MPEVLLMLNSRLASEENHINLLNTTKNSSWNKFLLDAQENDYYDKRFCK